MIEEKAQQLQKLAKKIVDDKVTPDLAAEATQLVFGDGNPDATIVFIGEAPGKNEDLRGVPFVGAAGKFLDEMLNSVGIDRDDVYITNIVKYRPPNNRDPLPEEKQAFWPYLLRQLAIIQPKIVATLGRHSGQAFLPDLRISADHGQPKRIPVLLDGKEQHMVVLPLYHPAAALYNGGLRETLLADFQSVKTILLSN
jgi:uracil-DNA glycosylase family 4